MAYDTPSGAILGVSWASLDNLYTLLVTLLGVGVDSPVIGGILALLVDNVDIRPFLISSSLDKYIISGKNDSRLEAEALNRTSIMMSVPEELVSAPWWSCECSNVEDTPMAMA
jgi:hypothetical protein